MVSIYRFVRGCVVVLIAYVLLRWSIPIALGVAVAFGVAGGYLGVLRHAGFEVVCNLLNIFRGSFPCGDAGVYRFTEQDVFDSFGLTEVSGCLALIACPVIYRPFFDFSFWALGFYYLYLVSVHLTVGWMMKKG